MSAEEIREGLGQVNAVTHLAIDDLAIPQEGHAIHAAAGREIAGAGESIEQRVAAIVHHFEIARHALNEIEGNNQTIESLLKSLPAGEHDIGAAVERAKQEVDKLKEISVFGALRGLRKLTGLGGHFKKLGSIVMSAPDVDPTLQMLNSAHDINEAIRNTL